MKLNSIEPNAHYDMVHGEPAVLEHDNDGSSIYRYNIHPEMAIPDGKSEEEQIGWVCVEVRTFAAPTKANLKKAIIRSILDETAEFELVNSYNKHVLGVIDDAKAVDDYREYLRFTEDLDNLLQTTLMSN